MKLIGVTQRVEENKRYEERRDALDQNWFRLLYQAGYLAIALPNNLDIVKSMLAELAIEGVVLTGGNSLLEHNGSASERDEMERSLIDWCNKNRKPVLGVCRGMQLLQNIDSVKHHQVSGHVMPNQTITIEGYRSEVNSYHQWGAFQAGASFVEFAKSNDGVIKGIRHHELPIIGVMWHPERFEPFREYDLKLLRELFL